MTQPTEDPNQAPRPVYAPPPADAPRYEAPPYQTPPPAPQYQYQPAPKPGPYGYFDGAGHAGELNRPLYGANIGQAFVRFFKNYANFGGRASRSEFWWMALVYSAGFIVLAIASAILEDLSYAMPFGGYGAWGGSRMIMGLVATVILLGSIVPWIAIGWRRLHDANLAGPLYLLALIPYLGALAVTVLTIMPPQPSGRRFDPPQR